MTDEMKCFVHLFLNSRYHQKSMLSKCCVSIVHMCITSTRWCHFKTPIGLSCLHEMHAINRQFQRGCVRMCECLRAFMNIKSKEKNSSIAGSEIRVVQSHVHTTHVHVQKGIACKRGHKHLEPQNA